MRHMNPRAGVIAGAFCFASTCAIALPGVAHAADTKGTALSLSLAKSRLVVGQPVQASGHVGSDLAGRAVVLEFFSNRTGWTALGSSVVSSSGRYAITRALPRSARVRVVLQAPAGAATASSSPLSSRERRVAVAARLAVASKRMNVTPGRRAVVLGRVTPGTAGLPVRMEVRSRGGWKTVARDRTASGGTYRLSLSRRSSTTAAARVIVSARNGLAASQRPLGRLNVYRRTYASWYGPGFFGRKTGCGGRLGYNQLGVAHKSLPCGTRLTFLHHGRSVTVRVIDRGPYVGGREFDLTAATKRRLGFVGHGSILVAG